MNEVPCKEYKVKNLLSFNLFIDISCTILLVCCFITVHAFLLYWALQKRSPIMLPFSSSVQQYADFAIIIFNQLFNLLLCSIFVQYSVYSAGQQALNQALNNLSKDILKFILVFRANKEQHFDFRFLFLTQLSTAMKLKEYLKL